MNKVKNKTTKSNILLVTAFLILASSTLVSASVEDLVNLYNFDFSQYNTIIVQNQEDYMLHG